MRHKYYSVKDEAVDHKRWKVNGEGQETTCKICMTNSDLHLSADIHLQSQYRFEHSLKYDRGQILPNTVLH